MSGLKASYLYFSGCVKAAFTLVIGGLRVFSEKFTGVCSFVLVYSFGLEFRCEVVLMAFKHMKGPTGCYTNRFQSRGPGILSLIS